MFITDTESLKAYHAKYRVWQGIPSIEVTKNGRIFSTFYSGGTGEQLGNYCVLLKSDDGGETFGEPIAVASPHDDGHRCYDSCLWIDLFDRLWFTWSYAPDHAVFAAICDNPDADELKWSQPKIIGKDVMMNKPTVLSTGEWFFPMAVWNHGINAISKKYETKDSVRGSFVYKSINNGYSFERISYADVPDRSYDEHMILERRDGSLAMYVRTVYGIGVSYSYDRGATWTKGQDSGLGGPCSRFFIRRLKSGRVLLINHKNTKLRTNLTAFLSDDDGKTWPHSLTIDNRMNVAYPDAVEANDGYIYITHDRERGGFLKNLSQAYECAREVLVSRITEQDILNGIVSSEGSYLCNIVSKLSTYEGENDPYEDVTMQFAKFINETYDNADDVAAYIFDVCYDECRNLSRLDMLTFDELIDSLYLSVDRTEVIKSILDLLFSIDVIYTDLPKIVDEVKEYVKDKLKETITINKMAHEMGISRHFLSYVFKKETGISIKSYEVNLRLTISKTLLLNTDLSVFEISKACGFESSSFFSRIFQQNEAVTPTEYRHLLKYTKDKNKDVLFGSNLMHKELISDIDVYAEKSSEVLTHSIVTMPDDKYSFLHECAIIEYEGVLFAAWYNNPKHELSGVCPIRFSRSFDLGKTWHSPKNVVIDETEALMYCPPVFGIDDGKLYMFVNSMVAPDHIHSLDLYVFNGDSFDLLYSRPIPFKLNTNVYRLNNGKLAIAGRIGELDGFPNTPALLISDSGKIDAEWRVVKMRENGDLHDGAKLVHPEVSLIISDNTIYAFCRNDQRQVPVMQLSTDNGETWSEFFTHDIPFSSSKIYSGTLSDGRHYCIGNVGGTRTTLALFITEDSKLKFTKCVILQSSTNHELGFGIRWHYPCCVEYDEKLYIIYTVDISNETGRGAICTCVDLSQL